MPPRQRPPLTAHEIAAYLEGGRIASQLEVPLISEELTFHLVNVAIEQHARVASEMPPGAWFHWFVRGMYDHVLAGQP